MSFRKKIAAFAAAALMSMAVCTNASAIVAEPAVKSSNLNYSEQAWEVNVDSSIVMDIGLCTKIEFFVKLQDPETYELEKAEGFYAGTETAFADFSGHISVNGTKWFGFNYYTLADASCDKTHAAVKSLGNGRYSFSADLTIIDLQQPNGVVTIKYADWGNKSPNYSMEVESAYIYDKTGDVVVEFDASGNSYLRKDIMPVTEAPVETTAPETTTEAVTTTEATTTEAITTTEATTVEETTAEETTVEETTAEETAETTTAATTTTTKATTTEPETVPETAAPAETTAAAAQTVPAQQAVASQAADFADRDSSLLIVGAVAGGVILAVIIAIVIFALKKKK